MGTDIHGVFQRRQPGGAWRDIPSEYEEGRDYDLFAALAGVRNGVGFAGVKRGDPVVPVSAPRGLPADFEVDDDGMHPVPPAVWDASRRAEWFKPGDEGYGAFWMGDHSRSWLTADEMLAWAERAQVVERIGVLDRAEFAGWGRGREPASYCSSIVGAGVQVIEQAAAEAGQPSTHVRVRWHVKTDVRLAYFFNEVARLRAAAANQEVRYVFGFDS